MSVVRRGTRLGVLVVGVIALVAGCSDDGGSDAAKATASTTTSAEPTPVEQFTGTLEDFYVVPDPLPPAAPGTLIRTMPIEAPADETGLRIMYHSTDAEDEDRAVTGTVYYPNVGAPEEGWPVLAWAHGTSGLAAPCAPSRNPSPPLDYGVEGVRVATDYVGLGPVGELHPYLSAAAEGHAVVDGVAAAATYPAPTRATDGWSPASPRADTPRRHQRDGRRSPARRRARRSGGAGARVSALADVR